MKPAEDEIACDNPHFPPLMLLLATMEEVSQGASLPLAMVVTTTADAHTFSFRTSQRYDFAIYQAGEEEWRWSDERFFLQVVGQETFTTDGTLFFERMDTGNLPGTGTYTLQGTLTTQGRVEGSVEAPGYVCTTFEVAEG